MKGRLSIGEFLKNDSHNSTKQLAESILSYLKDNISGEIGLVLPTDNEQAILIHSARTQNDNIYPILSGSEQAKVFNDIFELIQY